MQFCLDCGGNISDDTAIDDKLAGFCKDRVAGYGAVANLTTLRPEGILQTVERPVSGKVFGMSVPFFPRLGRVRVCANFRDGCVARETQHLSKRCREVLLHTCGKIAEAVPLVGLPKSVGASLGEGAKARLGLGQLSPGVTQIFRLILFTSSTGD